MGLRKWWRDRHSRPTRIPQDQPRLPSKEDLREFIYLDEVSLRSLLSSLTGDLRDNVSEETSNELQAEVAGALKAGNALTGAEASVSSRFQTTDNSRIQTSRKATVQSWFKQFHAIPKLRLIELTRPQKPAADESALLSMLDRSLLARSEELARGELVEFRVRLSADPVYRLGTMVAEYANMAEDYPEMFAASGALDALAAAQPVGKVLDRLLVGLIPIRAVAIDYSVITVDGVEYVAHREVLQGLTIPQTPLQVVGVTERSGYWKDLRRVLFSEAEVTILGRIARTGIQGDWTPVKLADLFRDTVPGLVEQLNEAGRTGTQLTPYAPRPVDTRLADALNDYATAILAHNARELSENESLELAAAISSVQGRSGSVSEQHGAFAALRSYLAERIGVTVGARRELALRERARAVSGLPLFPALTASNHRSAAPRRTPTLESLIDVEIIAMYW